MDVFEPNIRRYPLLETVLAQKGLQLKGIYRNSDVARLFDVTTRTVQDWCRDGKLQARDLPGRGRFVVPPSKTGHASSV
jgi:hypothetical protein